MIVSLVPVFCITLSSSQLQGPSLLIAPSVIRNIININYYNLESVADKCVDILNYTNVDESQ